MFRMNYWLTGLLAIGFHLRLVKAEEECSIKCPTTEEQKMTCGFAAEGSVYKMFPSKCALERHSKCYETSYVETPLKYCIKDHSKQVTFRRFYGESCPVFCPAHYRPVCGASKFKSYRYRAFNNGCYLDMINCRGEDEELGYVEVPLSYCGNHAMKNIYKEKVIISGLRDYRDYE